MKKLIFKFAFFLSPLVYSQTDGLNFQSIMFDSNGVKEVNASMLIRFTINNQSGSSLYSETQSVTTDSNGLISVIIGTGTGISSSSFSTLNWKDAHSITVARNHNGVYSNIGTSDFTYVPYSKIAQSVYASGIEINSGIVSATTFVGDGSGLTNLPTSTLTSIDQLSDARLIQESSQDGASLFIGNSDNSYSASYTGDYNTGFGHNALVSLQSGSDNDAFGDGALQYNTIGSGNAAFGSGALMANSTGSLNVAIGGGALEMSTTGSGNVAIGRAANETNRTGDKNITIGWHSDVASSGLVNAIAIGSEAIVNQSNSIQLGNHEITLVRTAGTVSATAFRGDGSEISNIQMSQIEGILIDNQANKLGIATNYVYGSNSVAIGAYAGATASNTVAIGYGAWTSMPNTVSIGNSQHESFAFGIAGAAPGRALQVGTTTSAGNGAYLTTGGVWTDASSIKLKTNFLRLDDNWLFSKIKNLDILRWEYKNSKETHIGPTSEQFVNEFGVGNGDDKHLSTLDVSGVALRGVQALIHKIEEKESEITELKNEVNRLSKLEILVKELESHISKLEELFIDSNND